MGVGPGPDFTQILNDMSRGVASKEDIDRLYAEVYDELKLIAAAKMRREREGHTYSPSDLLQKAYVKLVDSGRLEVTGRAHFLGLAANAMRQLLVDHARKKRSEKHGGGLQRVTLSRANVSDNNEEVDILDLHEALTRFETIDPRAARMIELRFFAGMDMESIAMVLGVTRRTLQNDWKMAKLWLNRAMSEGEHRDAG